ncbi:MAG: MgtC/SapB family protein [Syntrophales bacterium]|nr:MgtC/SapB family protein [Syntrophales bacterium]MDD5642128.1 MgtC/SapB family protein [Syntrophales bacterium]
MGNLWDLQMMFGKLALAAIIGAAIGFERETHGQAAGLRTNILVCVGSCLLMMLSLHMESLYRHLDQTHSVVRLDPARIASYAIASMGFLGAGAIITGRGTVRGLTTAASLWIVTGMGLAVGAGYILPAVFSMAISLLILYGFRRIKPVFSRDEHTILTLKYDKMDKPLDQIKAILNDYAISIQFVNYRVEFPSEAVTYRLRLQSKENKPWGQIVKRLSESQGLQAITWEEGEVP